MPRKPMILLVSLMALTLLPEAGEAADFSDPTWPCIQRKVENLSVGLMWPHPIAETETDPPTETAVEDLASRLALRRVELSELEPAVADFVRDHDADQNLLGQVFESTFDKIARQRSAIMKGIGEYSLKQITLTERIEATRVGMSTLMEAENPDFDEVDRLEEQLDWDERIYTDRQRSLTHVCETPVLMEKRLYAISQMLLAAAPQ